MPRTIPPGGAAAGLAACHGWNLRRAAIGPGSAGDRVL